MISYGQQLVPESQRVASSITMGVSWGVGGALVSLILAISKYLGQYELAFVLFAVSTAASSALCIWLPAASTAPAPSASPPVSVAA
jgi:FSR family fosmidomycin resistance protein-like MFS transporter